jgi:GntR family transcriptional repressor for pyruvate dehydrogenase complex
MTAWPVEPPLRGRAEAARPLRLPRVAEMVADALRDAILSGEMTEVPRLEDLIERFDVGPPAVREAMRILETEGLITVRRGNVGGADVHLPTADRVAYMVSLVLQSDAAALGDVGAALRQLEPLCAAMCAERSDRGKTVVPQLRAIVAEQAAALDDRVRTLEIVDRFHDTIVKECGNATMIVVVGALERIWARHASAVYDNDGAAPAPPAVMKASLKEHARLVTAIEKGDPRTADLAARHLAATHAYMSSTDDARKVTATTMRR